MKNVIRWLKRYCIEKGLLYLSITIKRKDEIGQDGFEVSIQKKTVSGIVKENFSKKSKMRIKVVRAESKTEV
jgi:hypothetical protein